MAGFIKQAMQKYREGNYEAAIDLFKQDLEIDRQNPKVWNALGICHTKIGQYDEALTCYENALELDIGNNTYEKNLNQIKSKISTNTRINGEKKFKKDHKINSETSYKNPITPLILSIFFPGLGQVYNGEGGINGLIRSIITGIGYCLFFIPGIFLHLFFIYNAYITRKQMNNGDIEVKDGAELDYVIYFLSIPLLILILIFGAAMTAAFVFGIAGSAQQSDTVPSSQLTNPIQTPTVIKTISTPIPTPTKIIKTSSPIIVPYSDLLREPEKYLDKDISISGTVIQAVDDQSVIQNRMGNDGQNIMIITNFDSADYSEQYENYLLLAIDRPLGKRIINGDEVSVVYTSKGLYTYATAEGAIATVPTGIIKSGNIL